MNIYNFKAKQIDGREISFDNYKGKVMLIVNTACNCGFTPQLEGLQKIYSEFKEKGFEILGFPSNQFANQDPGTNKEIYEFCTSTYGVTFALFEKIEVNGHNESPLFNYLKENASGLLTNEIKWNFTKFLIDRNGKVIKRFAPIIKPQNIIRDIEFLL